MDEVELCDQLWEQYQRDVIAWEAEAELVHAIRIARQVDAARILDRAMEQLQDEHVICRLIRVKRYLRSHKWCRPVATPRPALRVIPPPIRDNPLEVLLEKVERRNLERTPPIAPPNPPTPRRKPLEEFLHKMQTRSYQEKHSKS